MKTTYYAITQRNKGFYENVVYASYEHAVKAQDNVRDFYKIRCRINKVPAAKVPEKFEIVDDK